VCGKKRYLRKTMQASQHTIIKRLSAENSKRFGETFLVKKDTSEDLFIMKTVEKSNELGYEQLKNEASFSFKLCGLPSILSVEETEMTFTIFKKYEVGVDLNKYWSKIKRRQRLKILFEILSVLSPLFFELERQQIIHGDIKPENILVSEDDGKIDCSLLDFGLAFRKNEIPKRKSVFQLSYSAPEIVLNRLNCADFSTDVFSLCLVVYKLLSGHLPFSTGNPALLTHLQITYPIEKPFKMNKKIWEILEKGLIKHQFKNSPNNYAMEELDHFLMTTNEKRYRNFQEFEGRFTLLLPKK
jgi:serine/threonine protein kinase